MVKVESFNSFDIFFSNVQNPYFPIKKGYNLGEMVIVFNKYKYTGKYVTYHICVSTRITTFDKNISKYILQVSSSHDERKL